MSRQVKNTESATEGNNSDEAHNRTVCIICKCKEYKSRIYLKTDHWVRCDVCERWQHQQCAGIRPLKTKIEQFTCKVCRRVNWTVDHSKILWNFAKKTLDKSEERTTGTDLVKDFLKTNKNNKFHFKNDTIRKHFEKLLKDFVADQSNGILKRIKYAFLVRVKCSSTLIEDFKKSGELVMTPSGIICAFFRNGETLPLYATNNWEYHKKRQTAENRVDEPAAPIHSTSAHTQALLPATSTTDQVDAMITAAIDNSGLPGPDASGMVEDPPLDRRVLLANSSASSASDPQPSLLMNKVALVESKCSPSERLEGSCSAKETTETVSSLSEKPQAPVRKNPAPIPEDEPINPMLMNLVQVLETSEANTQREEPNDGFQNDTEAPFDPSNQFPSDQMQQFGRLAAHMDLVNGDDIPFEEVLDVGNEQFEEFVNSPAAINHDATYGGEPTLSGDVEQDDGQSPEKRRRRVYSFRTQDSTMISVDDFHTPSRPAALPGLQKTNRKEIPNPFVIHHNQMTIKTEEVEVPSILLEMPGVPANIFLYVVHSELSKLNESNKLFKSFMVDMGLLLNRNRHKLSSVIINEKELNYIFRGIINCEFLNPPEEDDDIIADSDWEDKVALKKVFSSLYDMTMGIGPLSTSLQGIRNDINKKIEKLKGNECVFLSRMDENFRFIFESRIESLPII